MWHFYLIYLFVPLFSFVFLLYLHILILIVPSIYIFSFSVIYYSDLLWNSNFSFMSSPAKLKSCMLVRLRGAFVASDRQSSARLHGRFLSFFSTGEGCGLLKLCIVILQGSVLVNRCLLVDFFVISFLFRFYFPFIYVFFTFILFLSFPSDCFLIFFIRLIFICYFLCQRRIN